MAACVCFLASACSDAAWEDGELPAAPRPLQADGSAQCLRTGKGSSSALSRAMHAKLSTEFFSSTGPGKLY